MIASHQLAIVLPCYNPKINWEENVIKNYLEIKTLTGIDHILLCIVNDGSTVGINDQQTNKIKEQIKDFIYINCKNNKGKGYALRKGLYTINAESYIYTDIDFPYEITSLLKLYKELDKKDVVIAVRNKSYYEQLPLIRKVISKMLQQFIKFFFKMPTSDTQGGLKGFNKKGKEIFLKTKVNRYLFDMEFIYLASKSLKIGVIEANLKQDIEFSGMNFKILFSEALNFFKILLIKNK